jgi:hypothetical protein
LVKDAKGLAMMERPEISEEKRYEDVLTDKEHFWHKSCVDYFEVTPGERGETSTLSLFSSYIRTAYAGRWVGDVG